MSVDELAELLYTAFIHTLSDLPPQWAMPKWDNLEAATQAEWIAFTQGLADTFAPIS